MENNIYPIRSFIRFQAKQQLLSEAQADADAQITDMPQDAGAEPAPQTTSIGETSQVTCFDPATIDSELLKEIAATLFNSERHPELYRPCQDIIEATAIEDAIALDIVSAYRRIKQNQQRIEVQALNKLL